MSPKRPLFPELHSLVDRLPVGHANRIPIVLGTLSNLFRASLTLDFPVPGFVGWGSPLLNSFNYFGGFKDIAGTLVDKGWTVIIPQLGPFSSNWERACELYAQLTHGRYDIPEFHETGADKSVATRMPTGMLKSTMELSLRLYSRRDNLFPPWPRGEGKRIHSLMPRMDLPRDVLKAGRGVKKTRCILLRTRKEEIRSGSWFTCYVMARRAIHTFQNVERKGGWNRWLHWQHHIMELLSSMCSRYVPFNFLETCYL